MFAKLFEIIKNTFNKKSSKEQMTFYDGKFEVHKKPFFFHEDMEQLKNIYGGDRTSIEKAMPYLSSEAIPLVNLAIPLTALENQLPLTVKYPHVQTGTYSSALEDTPYIAYPGSDFTMFCLEENGIVVGIWFDYGFLNEENGELFFSTLRAIGKFGDLLLVDWVWDKVIKINDDDELEEFARFMHDAYEHNMK